MGSQGIDSQTVWVSRARLAAELGLGRRRIGQLVDKGVITETDEGIDLHKALGEYQRKTDQSKRAAYAQRKSGRGQRVTRSVRPPPTAPKQLPPVSDPVDPDEPLDLFDYNKARGRKEAANAQLAEIKLAREAKSLISRDEVRAKEFEIARLLRDRILGFPARLANFVPAEAMKTLTDECEALVRDLQDASSKIAEG